MKKQVCVFVANGFEEIEGLTVVDLLRRADIEVTTVSITQDLIIHGAHGIDVCADVVFENMDYGKQDMLVLPGGMPGTNYLKEHKELERLLREFYQKKKYLAAICAAPSVFGQYGFLKGKKATCYPGFETYLEGAEVVSEPVAVSDFIVTSRGLGTAIPFALSLIEVLVGKDKAEEIGKGIIYYS